MSSSRPFHCSPEATVSPSPVEPAGKDHGEQLESPPSRCRRRFLLCLPLVLAACGFTPVYAPGGTGDKLDGRITFVAHSTQEGYLLIRNLEERLGRATAPVYRLAVTPTVTREGQAITAAGEITRFSLVGRASYSLHLIASDDVITSGSVNNFTGYSATGSTVETLAAEDDALERLMRIIADQIVARLLATTELPA